MNAAAKNTKPLLAEAAALLNTTPEKLAPRLYGMGYRQTCGRCHGSGSHSYNRIDGAMCFACSWRGEVAADVTPALIERIREDVEDGALDRYLDKMRIDQKITAQGKGLFRRLNSAYGTSEVYRRVREEGASSCALGSAYIDRVSGTEEAGVAEHLAADKWLSPEDRIEAMRRAVAFADAMETYLPVVAAHLAKSIESGLIARRVDEHKTMTAQINAGSFHAERSMRTAKMEQAQQDLADLAPKPTLDLSDLRAKIAARKNGYDRILT